METKELVKACEYVTKEENDSELLHRKRVAKAIGAQGEDEVLAEEIQSLKTAGFRMFIKKDKVFKDFAYHAGLNGSYTKTTGHDWGEIATFIFAGIATTAVFLLGYFVSPWCWWLLFGVIQILSIGTIFWGLNHVVIDYVGDIPDFALDNMDKISDVVGFPRITIHSASPLPTVERMAKVDPVMVCWLNDEVGVVVAMWDMDKEIAF